MPVIPALDRLRQEDHEFETSLGYIASPCPQKNKNQSEDGSSSGRVCLASTRPSVQTSVWKKWKEKKWRGRLIILAVSLNIPKRINRQSYFLKFLSVYDSYTGGYILIFSYVVTVYLS
jgi:hypothetical protein